jgi:PD-(D/E)XK nuclease superfamily
MVDLAALCSFSSERSRVTAVCNRYLLRANCSQTLSGPGAYKNDVTVDGGDALGAGIRRWRIERRRVEGLLVRCLTPAARPADADRRPLIEVPTTLSYSMLATYQACSRKAYLSFLAGFPGEPYHEFTGPGTAFHAAVEAAAAEQQAGRSPDFDGLLQAFTVSAAEAQGVAIYKVSEDETRMLRSYWDGPDRTATPSSSRPSSTGGLVPATCMDSSIASNAVRTARSS